MPDITRYPRYLLKMFSNVNCTLPIVDLLSINVGQEPRNVNRIEVENVAQQICDAFSTIGFVYIKNHGISDNSVSAVRNCGDLFFNLSDEVKRKCLRLDGDFWGWNPLATEWSNHGRPPDLNEALSISTKYTKVWPQEVQNMEEHCKKLFDQCLRLSQWLLKLIAIGLNLKDENYFNRHHQFEAEPNTTALKLLYYPAILSQSDIQTGQIRCGEHSDFGSITLLFQDENNGLQVRSRADEYIDAPPIAGTVLVNIGDMMQRWTGDKLVSTRHRVLIPEEESKRKRARRSIAFFVMPDDKSIIKTIDGFKTYEKITYGEFMKVRFNQAY